MRKKIEKILFLFGICLISILSCEMKAPIIPDNGSILYQKPTPPENLVATSGYKDSITLTWDAVDNATLYKIYGSEASDFGTLKLMGTSTSNRFILKRNMTPAVAIDPNQSYIFTVRAVTFFDNSSDSLESLNSNYAEGTLAPSKISLHAVVTDNYVDAYWNSCNIFSAWNSSNNPEMLYDAKFYLSYHQKGSEESTIIDENNAEDILPWQYKRIDINRAGMQQDEEYIFTASMEILDASGVVITTVKSDDVKITISSSKITTPIAKSDIKVSTDKYDRINVMWTVPDWTDGVSPENAMFKIERSVSGEDVWSVLADEISSTPETSVFKLDSYDTKGRMIMSFDDTTADPGVSYVYRITNAAKDSYGTVYQHDASELEVSAEGALFVPADPNMTIDATTDSPIQSTIKFTLSDIDLKKNPLSYIIVREIKHYDVNKTTCEKIHTFATDENEYTHVEKLIDCNECSIIKHTYKYRLQLVESDGFVYRDYGYIQNAGVDYEITFDIQDLFDESSLATSSDKINKIDLTWTESAIPSSLISYVKYSYSLDGIKDEFFTPDVSSRPNMSYTIKTTDTTVSKVILKAYIDNVCISSSSKPAAIYKMQEVETSYNDTAKEMKFKWNREEHLENLVYKFEYKRDDSSVWEEMKTIKYEDNVSEFAYTMPEIIDSKNIICQIRYSLWDKTEPDNIMYVDSNAAYANITDLDFYLNYGESLDKTTLILDDNKYVIKNCKFYLYNGSDFTTAELIAECNSNNALFNDISVTNEKQYFAYSFTYEKNGITYYTTKATNISGSKDKYGDMVIRNKFIPFDNTAKPDLTVYDVDTKSGTTSTNPYNDYLEFSWKRVYGASSYDITVIGDGNNALSETVIINVDELLHNEGKTESGTANSLGYLSYDNATGKYTYLSNVGIMRRTPTLNKFEIVGHDKNDALSSETDTFISSVGLHRAFKDVEIINFVNIVISKELVKANTQFNKDWWPPTSTSVFTSYQNKYENMDHGFVSIKSTKGGASYTKKDEEPGTISFSDYNEQVYKSMTLTTSESIKMDIKDEGGLGYLGTDPLETLGNGNVGLLNITVDRMTPSYSLKYKGVNKSNKNGSYDVTINGITTNIADSNDFVSVFEGL